MELNLTECSVLSSSRHRRFLRLLLLRRYDAFDWIWKTHLFGHVTETQGGLLVLDLSTKTIIQRIPEIRVYAHIEYDAGYLVAAGRGESIANFSSITYLKRT